MIRLALAVCCTALIGSCSVGSDAAKTVPDKPRLELSETVAQMVRDLKISGVVDLSQNGKTLTTEVFHDERLGATRSADLQTPFMVASLTKSFTAVLALQSVERGELDLDATISSYLPNFGAEYAGQVTVRQLLQNRSGIPHYVDIPGWFEPAVKDAFRAQSFLDTIAGLELRFEPGSDYYYSNANYYLIGLILEAVSGSSYEELLGAQILTPLGLGGTGQIYGAGAEEVAATHVRDGNGFREVQISNPILFRATASQYATAADLAVFGRALLDGQLLSPEMRDILWDAQAAMGFTIATVPVGESAFPVVTYNGELAGTTSMLTLFPEQNGVIVILTNNSTPYPTLVQLTLSLAEAAFTG